MTNRASHDRYGKKLLRTILGNRWITRGDDRKSVEMNGVRADLDGIILSENLSTVECAVEIEATVPTQASSSLINLAFHPAPKKLFVVILAQPQMGTRETVVRHFSFVWEKLSRDSEIPFGLVVLQGTGADPTEEVDLLLLRAGLKGLELDCQ
jgi:hypothetical protein